MAKKDDALWREFKVWTDAAWSSPHMADYCYKQAAELARLDNGMIVPIDKESIETQFCFGESGYDYDEAQDMAHHAATSEDYFMAENMRNFRRTMEELDKHGGHVFAVLFPSYGEGNKICGLSFRRDTEVLEAVGGSAFLEELKGRWHDFGRCKGYVCTDDDVLRIEAALDRATKAHEKKCRAYLKRYGMSKVQTWTYWRDR